MSFDEVLADQLDGRLCPVLILGRHIHIVDEHNAFLTLRWAVGSFLSLEKLRNDQVLNLIRYDLCGEGDKRWRIFLFRQLHQVVLNIERLSSARWAHQQEGTLVLEVKIEEMRVTSGVDRVDLNGDGWFDLHVADEIRPIFPRAFLLKDVHVVDDVAIWRN